MSRDYVDTGLWTMEKGKKMAILALDSCKRCYGRGRTGENVITGRVILCRCARTAEVLGGEAERKSIKAVTR